MKEWGGRRNEGEEVKIMVDVVEYIPTCYYPRASLTFHSNGTRPKDPDAQFFVGPHSIHMAN